MFSMIISKIKDKRNELNYYDETLKGLKYDFIVDIHQQRVLEGN